MNYPNLFKPVKIGRTLYRNRIFSSPTGHPDVTLDGEFTEDAIAYFGRKAQGGAAAVTLGEAIVDSVYGKNHPFQLSLDYGVVRHTLARIADTVTRHGAVISIELQHSGMQATPGLVTPGFRTASDIVYGPSACLWRGREIKEMPEEIILEIIDKFANAAFFAKDMGFGMVTVHAGHGWLLHQFLTPRFNVRGDKWGGSMENRARFATEVCDAIHKRCGKDFPVEMRISGVEIVRDGYGVDEGIRIAQAIDGHADIIHVSVGSFTTQNEEDESKTFNATSPCMFKEDGMNVKYAAEIKKHVTKSLVATVGALSDPAMLEDIIATGKADIVEMARGLVCDPDLPNKARDGRDGEIVRCMRCMTCFSSLMHRGTFVCALNPASGRERELSRHLPAVKKLKVLVAGGGIGGMQAALTAAQNGHDVVLCEKGVRLGGHIRCEENVPFKKHLKEYIEQRERMIAESNIELRLGTEVTPEYARAEGADVIVAALGATPVKPLIEGIDGANVMGAQEAYSDPEKVQAPAVIIGGGMVGLELAIYLNSLGKKATVIEMEEKTDPGLNFLHLDAIMLKIREEGVAADFSVRALSIDERGVLCETPGGERRYEAGTVIYAVGQSPLTEEAAALYDCAPRFYPIGDCIAPGTIAEATSAAMMTARNIGRF